MGSPLTSAKLTVSFHYDKPVFTYGNGPKVVKLAIELEMGRTIVRKRG